MSGNTAMNNTMETNCPSSPIEEYKSTDFNVDQQMSLYIPFVEKKHASTEYISNIFAHLNLAEVERVDFIEHTSEPNLYRVFVHMKKWYKNLSVEILQDRILNAENNEGGRIVHDDPEYWILKKNKNPVPNSYSEELLRLKVDIENLKNMVNTLNQTIISQQGYIQSFNWWINLHDTNIKYLSDELIKVKQLNMNLAENEVCKPEFIDWSSRLRKRKAGLKY